MAGDLVREVKGEGGGISHALHFYGAFIPDQRGIHAPGIGGDDIAMFLEPGIKKIGIGPCQVPDGIDVHVSQLLCGMGAHHEHVLHREGPHFFPDFLPVQRMDAIRFFKVRSHFSEQLACGDPHVYAEAEFLVNPVLKFRCRIKGVFPGQVAHIHKALVDGVSLDEGGVFPENLHHGFTGLHVDTVSGRDDLQLGAFDEGRKEGLSSFNPIFLAGDGLGQDDTMPALGVSSDDGGNGPDVQGLTVLEVPNGTPGEIG